MGSSKKGLKRANHTVPRSYLERFADEHKQITKVRLGGGEGRREPIKRSTVIRDFYLMETASGEWTDAVEDAFGDIENKGIQAIRAIVDQREWPPAKEHRVALSMWAALQHVRVPAVRQQGDEIADYLLKLTIAVKGKPQIREVMEKSLGRPPTAGEVEERWQSLTDFDSYSVKQHPNYHLKLIKDLVPRTAAFFHSRSWGLCRFEKKTLLTSDSPLVLVPRPGDDPYEGVGLATAAGFLLPLDRRAALMIRGDEGADSRIPPTAHVAKTINQKVVLEAYRSVFHHPDDKILDGLVVPEPSTREVDIRGDLRGFLMPDGWPAPVESVDS
ncbi:DUF4238 domain-containing protein [Streptomyces sp. NPDC005803]|uniref:DUF4238 domain-containing protein n=1 Tax=Streptomyces sp. NPDC005803 TaxID=3154297 RepID=UPI0033FBAC10